MSIFKRPELKDQTNISLPEKISSRLAQRGGAGTEVGQTCGVDEGTCGLHGLVTHLEGCPKDLATGTMGRRDDGTTGRRDGLGKLRVSWKTLANSASDIFHIFSVSASWFEDVRRCSKMFEVDFESWVMLCRSLDRWAHIPGDVFRCSQETPLRLHWDPWKQTQRRLCLVHFGCSIVNQADCSRFEYRESLIIII